MMEFKCCLSNQGAAYIPGNAINVLEVYEFKSLSQIDPDDPDDFVRDTKIIKVTKQKMHALRCIETLNAQTGLEWRLA